MPSLNWIGKQAVVRHHEEVPYHLLRCNSELSVGDVDSGNLIIQGDNLLALKALLPYYAGQVRCIYIDPPYNTGNEKWVYNDNVNSPEIRKWLGQVVGKEAEDLSRHDKWLCMMYPRLVLLRELLSEDGSIWMSIDDNESHHARMLMDEVFGSSNFITTIIWQKIYTLKNSARHFSEMHDYILVYARRKSQLRLNKFARTDKQDDAYSNPDNDPNGPWTTNALQARNFYGAGRYAIETPTGGKIPGPPPGTYWRIDEPKFKQYEAEGRIWWGDDGTNAPRIKRYFSEVKGKGVIPATLWFHDNAGTNSEAKVELRTIMSDQADLFITPKPVRLLRRILQIATKPGDLVLDSFAGTGTLGQAVLEENAVDNGHRRFILVEIEEGVVRTTTRERLRRVVEGYSFSGNERVELMSEKLTVSSIRDSSELFAEIADLKQEYADEFEAFETTIEKDHLVLRGRRQIVDSRPGIGSGFRFCELGTALFASNGQIESAVVRFVDLARHVFFCETGVPLPTNFRATSPLLGIHNGIAVYLLYNGILKDVEPDGGNILTRTLLAALPSHDGPRVIYAAGSLLSREYLRSRGITFRQTPYEIKAR